MTDRNGYTRPAPVPNPSVRDAVRGHPIHVGLFCDRCGATREADILARSTPEAYAGLRHYLNGEGWLSTPRGDWCPTCAVRTVYVDDAEALELEMPRDAWPGFEFVRGGNTYRAVDVSTDPSTTYLKWERL